MQENLELLLVGIFGLIAALTALQAAKTPQPPPASGSMPELRQIGPYVLVDRIAAGSMGEVYRARHRVSGHERALKLLPRDANEREQQQFEREAIWGARVAHPNAVAVYDHGSAADGTRWLAMELLDGISLEELVEREGPLAPGRVISILLQVVAALGAVHDLGLVHRDVKPQNILLCRAAGGQDRVKLLDFGLVKPTSERSLAGARDPIVGTPLYISPEALAAPNAVDRRSDLYGIGAVAHFLLSGAPVFTGRSVIEVCSHHLLTPPEPLSQRVGWGIERDLERVVLDCLSKEPSARPADARELMRRLERCADHDDARIEGPRRAEPSKRGNSYDRSGRPAPLRLASLRQRRAEPGSTLEGGFRTLGSLSAR